MKTHVLKHKDKVSNLNDEVKRTGENFTKKVTRAIKTESWKLNFFELAWMAVVTVFVGLYLAYNIGYGKSPDNNLIFYFGTYTAVTVIMTVVIRMFKTSAEKDAEEKTQRVLLRCNNHIFHLMANSRNQSMADMDEMQRRIYAATIVLQNPESSSSELEIAIYDLTGDADLSNAMSRIETFRHHGMMSRINDEYLKIEKIVNQHHEALSEVSPAAAEIFLFRMQGFAPEMQTGTTRSVGFLERSLHALEFNNLDLLPFEDVSSIFAFAFEMLNGREIPVLHPEFKGHEDYMEAQDKLDRSRSLLKQAIAKRNSRLKALADLLSSEIESDIVMPTTFDSEELIVVVENLYSDYKDHTSKAIEKNDKKELKRLQKVLRDSFKYQEKIERHQRRANRYLTIYNNIQKSYNKQWRKHGKSIELILGDDKGTPKNSIAIRENYITLDDEQKVSLAKKLINLHKHTLKDQRKTHYKFTNLEFSHNDFKRLALEYILILDEMLGFSQPEEMFAIEFSNAPCIEHIDINAPSRTKVGMAIISIEELQQTRKKVAHRLAYNLRQYYKVVLNKATIDYFVKNFGADKEQLAEINTQQLQEQKSVEERYSVHLKIKDWERSFSPMLRRIKTTLSKK